MFLKQATRLRGIAGNMLPNRAAAINRERAIATASRTKKGRGNFVLPRPVGRCDSSRELFGLDLDLLGLCLLSLGQRDGEDAVFVLRLNLIRVHVRG